MSSEAPPARPALRAPRLLLALLLLAFAAFAAVGGARSASAAAAQVPAPAAASPVRIMPLDDSIAGPSGCWRALLWNQLQKTGYTNTDFVGTLPEQGCGVPYDGDNEGHGGILATGIAGQNQLPGWLSATSPDIVLMHLGTNDIRSGMAPSQILAAFTTMVGQMRDSNPDMKVLVAQIIPMNPPACPACAQRVIDLDAQIPAWAKSVSTAQSPVTVVDQWTGFDDATDTSDGVHPNDAGTVKIAARWYPPLAALLTPGSGTSTGTSTGTSSGTSTGGTGGPACKAVLTVSSIWQGGFQTDVTVTAVTALTSWTVTLTGVRITQIWNGTAVSNPDGTVVIHSSPWNSVLAPGTSINFGFLASGYPPPAPVPTCSTP